MMGLVIAASRRILVSHASTPGCHRANHETDIRQEAARRGITAAQLAAANAAAPPASAARPKPVSFALFKHPSPSLPKDKIVSRSFENLQIRIRNKTARVGIIGLGYVGLPLARAFVASGFSVVGFDIDPSKVDRLQRGESYIGHIPSKVIGQMRSTGFVATERFDRLNEPDAILICVPTPLSEAREPDLSYVVNSTKAIAASLRSEQLIILESTTYPGTTRGVVLPILAEAGLRAGEDFFLAFSPEREDPGNDTYTVETIPKVVGGLNSASLELAAGLYERVARNVIRASSLEVAEACKILENTYRAINIALINELKVLYGRMGINIWEVIEVARTKPFGFQAFYPGPGLGGHCIPIDPFYLSWAARKHGLATRFIELAGEINTAMPEYVLARVIDALNERGRPIRGSKISILGMAYKRDVDDPRESPGFALMDLLIQRGAKVTYNDPYIPALPAMRRYPHLSMNSHPLTEEYLQNQDCILIVTDHSAYQWSWIVENAALVVDTRNATSRVERFRERIVLA
jgi:UDP-N-acetyl-D-glucosamine dehydrogenase